MDIDTASHDDLAAALHACGYCPEYTSTHTADELRAALRKEGAAAYRAANAYRKPAKAAKPASKRAPSRARREADREMMEDMGWYD